MKSTMDFYRTAKPGHPAPGKAVNMIAAFILTAGYIAIGGCAGPNGRNSGEAPVTVKTCTAESRAGLRTSSYVGTVQAKKSALLTCPYPGTVVSLNVSQGQYVEKGQTIAEINSQSVISSREMALATLAQAEDGYKRLSEVHSSGSVADVKMMEIETQLSKARASAKAAEQAYEDCRIKAPFSGVIGEIMIDEGVNAPVGQAVARILDISSVEIRFPVPENEINRIKKGEKAVIEVAAAGGREFCASVSEKGMVASPLSHSYDCIAVPEEAAEGLMPGMVCKVYLESQAHDGMVLPASAIRTDASGRYVWCVENGIVTKKYIVTGSFAGQGVIIEDGIEEGDRIIVQGGQKVSTGMKVSVLE